TAARAPVLAGRLAAALAEIYDELPADAGRAARVEREIRARGADPAFLLLAAEPAESPPGAPAVGLLLAVPHEDALLGTSSSLLRVLYTEAPFRQRGIATRLLASAGEILTKRGVASMTAEPLYGDDAIVGIFERRGWVRGRMVLTHSLS
ncbi:MAG TPA: hypothetical protein VKE69_11025, partial [Planctomycetota bacterium]|nr:hypothetical protein [Planctomycetota bacterium]